MILSKAEIVELIEKSNLASGCVDLQQQLQPSGLDMTVAKLYKISSRGSIDFDNSQRVLSQSEEIAFDGEGWVELAPGAYKLQFNEVLSLPLDVAAITILRSSVMRCGCMMHNGFWDPGYTGKGESVLLVGAQGLRLKKNAKIAQAVFYKLSSPAGEGYAGVHQFEGTQNKK